MWYVIWRLNVCHITYSYNNCTYQRLVDTEAAQRYDKFNQPFTTREWSKGFPLTNTASGPLKLDVIEYRWKYQNLNCLVERERGLWRFPLWTTSLWFAVQTFKMQHDVIWCLPFYSHEIVLILSTKMGTSSCNVRYEIVLIV